MSCKPWVALGLLLALTGCDEKKPPPTPPKKDPKTEAKDAADPKLAAAMAAASAKAPAAKKTTTQDGPPENGIFPPGVADKLMVRGDPPKVELINDGTEPRSQLPTGLAAWKGTATITTSVRLGPRNALPSIEYTVTLGPEKQEKKEKEKDGDAGAGGPLVLLGAVGVAKLAAEQPGKLPEGVQKEVAKLKGSQLRWVSDESGLAREPSSIVTKDAPADLQRSLDAAAEAMFYLSVPPPPKPVGAGASWIAGSRQVLGNVEVISYRLYKVKSISQEGVELTLESREYAVSEKFTIPGLPPNATVSQFEAMAQGEITLSSKESLGVKGILSRQFTLGLQMEQAPPGAVMGIQFVSETSVTRGGK
ncbi:MAG: hypothetical protein RMJ98_08115 [Myxococcales bacterium]|nr:hypothetical protein [Polyangiaceae bacterium]MDW8249251.1 hypothetical protein [Myxococcales bacterium]